MFDSQKGFVTSILEWMEYWIMLLLVQRIFGTFCFRILNLCEFEKYFRLVFFYRCYSLFRDGPHYSLPRIQNNCILSNILKYIYFLSSSILGQLQFEVFFHVVPF